MRARSPNTIGTERLCDWHMPKLCCLCTVSVYHCADVVVYGTNTFTHPNFHRHRHAHTLICMSEAYSQAALQAVHTTALGHSNNTWSKRASKQKAFSLPCLFGFHSIDFAFFAFTHTVHQQHCSDHAHRASTSDIYTHMKDIKRKYRCKSIDFDNDSIQSGMVAFAIYKPLEANTIHLNVERIFPW